METIQHKMFGEGEVIGKEVKANDIYVTVRFNSGKEMRFAAESFTLGVMTAEGALKDEIDAILADRQAAEEARRSTIREVPVAAPVAAAVRSSRRHGRTPTRPVTVRGPIQSNYEAYLMAAGYSLVTPKGHPSTVPQYSRAIELVVDKENLTWSELEQNIANIIPKYDVGGVFEDFGNKSKKTVINALKRFGEFVSA